MSDGYPVCSDTIANTLSTTESLAAPLSAEDQELVAALADLDPGLLYHGTLPARTAAGLDALLTAPVETVHGLAAARIWKLVGDQ